MKMPVLSTLTTENLICRVALFGLQTVHSCIGKPFNRQAVHSDIRMSFNWQTVHSCIGMPFNWQTVNCYIWMSFNRLLSFECSSYICV